MSCSPGSESDPWTLAPQAKETYNGLLSTLSQSGRTVLPFYYDWRKPPMQNAAALLQFIQSVTQPGENVDLVAHSFGGLVARAYIEQTQTNARIANMLAVGTPFGGVLVSYPAWSGADLSKYPGSLGSRIYLESLLHFCQRIHNISRLEALRTYAPSLQQTLPTFDYIRSVDSDTLTPVASMHSQNGWLPNMSFPAPFYAIRMGTFRGTGQTTSEEYAVIPANNREANLNLWTDGKPIRTIHSANGDGTVLSASTVIDGADNSRSETLSHNALVASANGIKVILGYFGITPPAVIPMTIPSNPASAVMIWSDGATLELTHPDRTKQRDHQGLLLVPNPVRGTGILTIRPSTYRSNISVGQMLPNGNVLWHDYAFRGTAERRLPLIYNPDNPTDDPLNSAH